MATNLEKIISERNIHFRCVLCKKEVTKEVSPGVVTCPDCGPAGTVDVVYDYQAIAKKITPQDIFKSTNFSVQRYEELLPVSFPSDIQIKVGWTPLVLAPRLANKLGLKSKLFIKDESREPSASLKDRASIIATIDCLSRGLPKIATASTGNAASSLATICASIGQDAIIFVPAKAPRPKLAQLQMCGAELFLVDGTYDDAFALCSEACGKFGWYNRSTSINPWTRDGKKTVSLEIWEQLGGVAPSKVFVSVGDGSIVSGVYKGFYDLLQLGWIKQLPQVYGVQAEGSSVIAKGFEERKITPTACTTYADSISVTNPADYAKAWEAIAESKGEFVVVSDEEIQAAAKLLTSNTGIFGEPSGATSVAGLNHFMKTHEIKDDEVVVCVMTGSGLKDVDGALKACGKLPEPISPSVKALPY